MAEVLHRSVASRASPRSANYYDGAAAPQTSATTLNLVDRSRYGDRLSVPSASDSQRSGGDDDDVSSESNFEESETSAFDSDTDSTASSSDASISAEDEDTESSSSRRRRHPTSSRSKPPASAPIDVRLRRVASVPEATAAERRHFDNQPTSSFSEMKSDFSSPITSPRNTHSPEDTRRSLSLPLSGVGVGLPSAPSASSASPSTQCSISERRRHLMVPLDSIPEVSSEDERLDDTASESSIRGTVGTSQSCPSLHRAQQNSRGTPRGSSRATPRGEPSSHLFSRREESFDGADIRRRSSTSTPRHGNFNLPTRLAARPSTTSTPRHGGVTPRVMASPRVVAASYGGGSNGGQGFRVPMIVNALLAYVSGLTWTQLRNAALLSPVAFVCAMCLAIAVGCVLFVAFLVLAPFAWILVVLYVLVPSFFKKMLAYLHGIFVAPITSRVHTVFMRILNAGTEMKRRFSSSSNNGDNSRASTQGAVSPAAADNSRANNNISSGGG